MNIHVGTGILRFCVLLCLNGENTLAVIVSFGDCSSMQHACSGASSARQATGTPAQISRGGQVNLVCVG
jgi:hypothetical protein